MKKNSLFIIGLLFSSLICTYGQHPFSPWNSTEISRTESYRNGQLVGKSEYVKEGNKIIVYSTDIRLMQTHINRELILGDSVMEIFGYVPDGFQTHYSKYTYLDGVLKIYEYENKHRYDGIYELIRNSDRYRIFL